MIAENSAEIRGGGIYNSGTLKLTGVTVVRNRSDGTENEECYADEPANWPCCGGGGVWNDRVNGVSMTHSVVALNEVGGRDGERTIGHDCAGSPISVLGHSGIGDTTDCVISTSNAHTNLIDFDPLLDELTTESGPGRIYALPLPGSPLIDAGLMPGRGGCSLRDQVNRLRNVGDFDGVVNCEIGAVEKPRQ